MFRDFGPKIDKCLKMHKLSQFQNNYTFFSSIVLISLELLSWSIRGTFDQSRQNQAMTPQFGPIRVSCFIFINIVFQRLNIKRRLKYELFLPVWAETDFEPG